MKNVRSTLIILFSGFWVTTNAISEKDSLLQIINTTTNDTLMAKAMRSVAWKMMYSNSDSAIVLTKQAMVILGGDSVNFKNLNRVKNLAIFSDVLNTTGVLHWASSQYFEAVEYYEISLQIRDSLGLKKGVASSLNNIGLVHWNLANYPRALESYFAALKIYEGLEDYKGMALTNNNIGIVYEEQLENATAEPFYLKSLELYQKINNQNGVAVACNNLGVIYNNLHQFDLAIKYLSNALRIRKELNLEKGMATSFSNLGNSYTMIFNRKDSLLYLDMYRQWKDSPERLLDTSLYYLQQAYSVQEKLGGGEKLIYSLSGIASVYVAKKQYQKAIEFNTKAKELAQSVGSLQNEFEACESLSASYYNWGLSVSDINLKAELMQKSVEFHNEFSKIKTLVYNENMQRDLGKLEARHDYEVEEIRNNQREEMERKQLQTETNRRDNLQYSIIFLGLLLVFGLVLSLGFIKLSSTFAEGLIFFAFLLLFEFLLVLSDPFVDRLTNSEPIYKLLLNALLAGLIFPVHSIFERKLKKRLVKSKNEINENN